MRLTLVGQGRFTIAARDDHLLCLTRQDDIGGCQEMHLYRVTVGVVWGETVVFALAESPEGAVAQASCAVHGEKKVDSSSDKATRVPFVIRGWSGNTF